MSYKYHILGINNSRPNLTSEMINWYFGQLKCYIISIYKSKYTVQWRYNAVQFITILHTAHCDDNGST